MFEDFMALDRADLFKLKLQINTAREVHNQPFKYKTEKVKKQKTFKKLRQFKAW